MIRSSLAVGLAMLLVLSFATIASADLMVIQKIVNGGVSGMGASETEDTTYTCPTMQAHWTKTKFTGGVLGALTSDQISKTIIRLDKDVEWTLKPEKKEYTERSLADMRDQMKKSKDEMKEKMKEKDDEVEITVRFDIERPGTKKTINGYTCENAIMHMYMDSKNKKTGETSTSEMEMNGWWTKDIPGTEVQQEFGLNYAKKLGLDAPGSMDAAAAMMAQFKIDPEKMKEKMKDLGTFPMEMVYTYYLMDKATWEKQHPAGDASKQQVKEEPKKEEEEESGGGGFGGMFGNLIKKAVKPKAEDKPKADQNPNERPTMMRFTTTTLGIKVIPSSSAHYDIPAGYEKD